MCWSGFALVWWWWCWCLLLFAFRICFTYEFSRCDLECAAPQPRVFFLARLLEPTETYFPHNVVLYRCDSSTGCCEASNKECTVFTRECVTVKVSVKNITTRTFSRPQRFTFWNHTECSCQLTTNVTATSDLCDGDDFSL